MAGRVVVVGGQGERRAQDVATESLAAIREPRVEREPVQPPGG